MRSRSSSRAARSTAAGLLLLLTACGGGDGADPTETPTGEETNAVGPIPQTRAGTATRWVIDQLEQQEGPTQSEAEEYFDQTFLEQVPAGELATVFAQLRAVGPFAVEDYTGSEDSAQLALTGPEERFVLHVGTTAEGLVHTLFFEAAQEVPPIDNLDGLATAVAELPAESSLLVAEVTDAECRPLVADDADVSRPIGSIIKLYVLDAVRHAVADGELEWDQALTLTDDLRSLPSGTLQEEPAGTEVSVADAAAAMIAISDNTATDLLIDAVGRPAVQAAVERLGHHDPAAMDPLLTTREMFQLGFTDVELRDRWAQAGDGERRELIEELPGGEVVLDEAMASDVVWVEDLDWFATAEDLCRAHVALQQESAERAEVREILAANPGIEVPSGWDYAAFKGGSSTGEMAGSWYLEDGNGRQVVIVLQIAGQDVTAVPDAGWLAGVVEQGAEVLSEGTDD